MGNGSINIAVSIPPDMFKWLEQPQNKKRINRSRLFQDAVNKLRNPQSERMHPATMLTIIMGSIFGVSLMVASSLAGLYSGWLTQVTFFMLGAVVLMSALVTMIKEVRKKSVLQ